MILGQLGFMNCKINIRLENSRHPSGRRELNAILDARHAVRRTLIVLRLLTGATRVEAVALGGCKFAGMDGNLPERGARINEKPCTSTE
jgi:hypothetical protein